MSIIGLQQSLAASGFYTDLSDHYLLYNLCSEHLDNNTLLKLYEIMTAMNDVGAADHAEYAIINGWSQRPNNFQDLTANLGNIYKLVINYH